MPEITHEVSIEFYVYCANCGAGLCRNTTVDKVRASGTPRINVDPCQNCISNARVEGYQEGHREGYQKAEEDHE